MIYQRKKSHKYNQKKKLREKTTYYIRKRDQWVQDDDIKEEQYLR